MMYERKPSRFERRQRRQREAEREQRLRGVILTPAAVAVWRARVERTIERRRAWSAAPHSLITFDRVVARERQARRALIFAEKEHDTQLRGTALRDLYAAQRRQRVLRRRAA